MNPVIYTHRAKKRKQEKEEETMTQYSADDLSGWEFKIVRSTFGRFNNPEVVRRLIAEEAQNGWEMVEKFDECRIRFKRRTDKRALHSGGSIDPYRTNYGPGNAVMPLIAVTVALLLAGVMFLFDAKGHADAFLWPGIVIGVVLIMVVVMIIVRRR